MSWFSSAVLFGVCVVAGTPSALAQPATPPAGEEPATPERAVPPPDATPPPAADAPVAAPPEGPQAAAPAPEHPQTPPPPEEPPPAPPPPPESSIPDGEAPAKPVPPAFPPAIPNVDYGARLRAGLKFQNPEEPEQMNDVGQELGADLYMSGQVHRFFKWQVGLTLNYSGTPGAPAAISVTPLDAIARFEPLPEFNVYIGRMLVVVDRFNPSGPWGMDEFFFPGFFPLVAAPALPKAGALGRDVGTTVWGAPFKGHVKYYLGAFNLHDPALSPLFSGRVQVSLLNGEPAFYHRTTYYGTKDLISVGVGGQYQKDGSVQPVPVTTPPTVPLTDDYSGISADLTVEKNIGDAGTLSVVGAFSKFEGDYQRWENFWLASLGYMLPEPIGIGKLRGTVRYQRGLDTADGATASSVIDAQLSYNIAAWFARVALGYRRGETFLAATMAGPAVTQASNMMYLGITLADP